MRMEPFSARFPKPLLPVLDRPVIAHQIGWMAAVGVQEVIVVVSHLARQIADALGDGSDFGVRLRYVEQGEPMGIAHAVGKVEPFVDRPFLLFLGDIFFVPRDLGEMFRMMRDESFRAVLAVKQEAEVDAIRRNFAVVMADGGRVKRVIEKPRHPQSRLKGCGVYLFDLPFFDAIRRTPRSALRDEYELTDAIQIFIDDEQPVGATEAVESDTNLTFPRDLWQCNLNELGRTGLERLVSPEAEVQEGAEIVRSVVGARSRVAAGVRVEDAMVFPDTRVDHDAIGCIVTPDTRVTFREDP